MSTPADQLAAESDSPKRAAQARVSASSPEIKATQSLASKFGLPVKESGHSPWVLVLAGSLIVGLLVVAVQFYAPREPAIKLEMFSSNLNDKLLQAALVGSEQQYRINLQKRSEEKTGLLNPSTNISVPELKAGFLIPLCPCPLEGRFGLWGEGGKWVCLQHYSSGKRPLVISVGSKGDTSFETAVHTRLKAFSHTFDFSLSIAQQQKMQLYKEFLKFYNGGVSGSADLDKYAEMFPTASFVTVPEMLRMIGTDYIDIFKIDCEGCEHGVVDDMVRHYSKDSVPFGQIQMEIHNIENTMKQMKLLLGLESLGYRMFHSEINGWWTRGYELAYIHERLVQPRVAAVRKQ